MTSLLATHTGALCIVPSVKPFLDDGIIFILLFITFINMQYQHGQHQFGIKSSHNVEEKDAIIKSLQWELGMLKEQVEEFNDLRMSVIKVTGKNGVRKLKDKYLTTS